MFGKAIPFVCLLLFSVRCQKESVQKVSRVSKFRVLERKNKLPYDPVVPDDPLRFSPLNVQDNDWGLRGQYTTYTNNKGENYFKLKMVIESPVPLKQDFLYQTYA